MRTAIDQCQDFLTVIFKPEDIIEFRPIHGGKRRWGTLADLEDIVSWLEKLNAAQAQIYFGANPRKSRGGSKAGDVILARCLFADFDDNATPEDAMRRIVVAGLPAPTVVVRTGGGVHCWWLLETPVQDLAVWTQRMKAMIAAMGSDKTVHDSPRIMRLPGFINHKYAHNPTAEIVSVDRTRVYSWDEMAPRDIAQASREFLVRGTLLPSNKRRETIFTVACDLKARGWSLAAAEDAIMSVSKKLDLAAQDVADLPRQIRSAFSRDREPLRGRAAVVRAKRDRAELLPTEESEMPASAANVNERETRTDAGLCKRLCHEGQGRIHWVTDRKTWVRWDGCRWVDDPDGGEPRRLSKAIAASLWAEAGPSASRTVVKFCRDAASRRGIDAATALAKSEPGVEAAAESFDADAYAINCDNGILDLKTMTLRPHDSGARMTKLAPVRFDAKAECPRWSDFLSEVMLGDDEMVAYLQRSMGLALSGDVSEQILSIHWGDGCNGKSLFFTVLGKILGDYAAPIPAAILVTAAGERDREKSVSRLVGRRLCFAQEPDEGGKLAEGSLKAITGGDRLTARVEWERARIVSPTWHLHVCMNQLPQVRGTDYGLWRRLHIVRWGRTFGPEEQRPRAEMEQELLSEAPGIFRWLCEGFTSWSRGGLRPPPSVTDLTKKVRLFSDSVSRWLASDEVAREDGAETPAGELYAAYSRFCLDEGCSAVTQAMFGRNLEGRGIKKCRPKSGVWRDATVRVGLRLTTSYARLTSAGA